VAQVDSVDRLLEVAAADLNARRFAPNIVVHVHTRLWRGPLLLKQGLGAYNDWTDVFEPVRWRWPLSRQWRPIQSPQDAARKIEWFLTNRPDLPPDERPTGWTRE
jgi:hypothetical protein